MTEISKLILAVDATQVKAGGIALDSLAASGVKAELATGALAKANETLKNSAKGMTAEQLKMNESLKAAEALGTNIGRTITVGLLAAAAAATAAAYAFEKLVGNVANYQDLAERTGGDPAGLASLRTAADVGGASVESMVLAVNRLQLSLSKVDDESKGAGKAIAAIGLNIEDFKKLKADEQLREIGKALNEYVDGGGKVAVVQTLMGRGAAAMLPAFKELGNEQVRANGLTNEQIRLADDYKDAQKRVTSELTQYAELIAIRVLPVVTEFIASAKDVVKGLYDVGKSADTLSKNDSIRKWAEEIATYLAFVVDSTLSVGSVFGIVGTQIASVIAKIASPEVGDTPAQTIARRKAIGEAASEDIERYLKNTSRMRDAIATRRTAFAAEEAKFKDPRILGPVGSIADQVKKSLDFNPSPDKPQARSAVDTDAKSYESLIKSIKSKIEQNELEIQYGDKLTESDKMRIKFNGDLGTRLGAVAKANVQGKLKELGLTEQIITQTKRNMEAAQADLDMQREVEKVMADQSDRIAKIAVDYRNAEIAAQSYIDTISKQAAREVAGLGMGTAFRKEQSGINAIEDKQTTQRQGLESDLRRSQITQMQFDQYLDIVNGTYEKELAIYKKSRDDIKLAQGDWLLGASEAMKNYFDDVSNVYKQTDNLVTKAFKGMEDALVSFVTTGKLDFRSLVDSIISDMIRMNIQKNITGPLAESLSGGGLLRLFGGLFGGAGAGAGSGSGGLDLAAVGLAKGGVLNSPGLSAYSGQIVSSPTVFPFARGVGLMGEAGPEAIMPLKRGPDGKLGVSAGKAGGRDITFAPTINVDSRTDSGEVYVSVQRALAENNRMWTEHLRREGVLA